MTILGEMLVKDGLDQGIREGLQQGIRQGIRQGEEKLGRLIQLLIQNSRSDEISRAVTDRQYQEALYQPVGQIGEVPSPIRSCDAHSYRPFAGLIAQNPATL